MMKKPRVFGDFIFWSNGQAYLFAFGSPRKVAVIHDAPTGTATSDIVQKRKFSGNLLKKRVLSTNKEYFNQSAPKKLKKWIFVTLI